MSHQREPAKAISSRLLNMKFMQRSSTASSPSSTPNSAQAKPSKRQKLANGSPSTPASERSNQTAVIANSEDQKLAGILLKQAEAAGDTHWTLHRNGVSPSSPGSGLNVVSMGYGVIDTPQRVADTAAGQDESDVDDEVPHLQRSKSSGRLSFGKFNKVIEKRANPDQEPSSSDDSDSDEEDVDGDLSSADEDEDSGDGKSTERRLDRQAAKAMQQEEARSQRKVRRKAEKSQSGREAQSGKSQSVGLRGLSSISNGGGANKISCYNCGGNHKAQGCPSKGSKKRKR